jgi:hypothetical protein
VAFSPGTAIDSPGPSGAGDIQVVRADPADRLRFEALHWAAAPIGAAFEVLTTELMLLSRDRKGAVVLKTKKGTAPLRSRLSNAVAAQ